MTIKSYNDLDTLAKDINEPELNQAEVEEILRCMDGSQMTPNGWKGSSQINTFGQAIDGNKRNHTTAHRNAKFRADAKDQAETDKKYVATCHFHYTIYMTPKNALMFIKLVKYFQKRNVMVLFESSSQATWSRHLKSWRGGFARIPRDIMRHQDLKDFRIDFGLDNPDLPETPTIMELLGKITK